MKGSGRGVTQPRPSGRLVNDPSLWITRGRRSLESGPGPDPSSTHLPHSFDVPIPFRHMGEGVRVCSTPVLSSSPHFRTRVRIADTLPVCREDLPGRPCVRGVDPVSGRPDSPISPYTGSVWLVVCPPWSSTTDTQRVTISVYCSVETRRGCQRVKGVSDTNRTDER